MKIPLGAIASLTASLRSSADGRLSSKAKKSDQPGVQQGTSCQKSHLALSASSTASHIPAMQQHHTYLQCLATNTKRNVRSIEKSHKRYRAHSNGAYWHISYQMMRAWHKQHAIGGIFKPHRPKLWRPRTRKFLRAAPGCLRG